MKGKGGERRGTAVERRGGGRWNWTGTRKEFRKKMERIWEGKPNWEGTKGQYRRDIGEAERKGKI